MANNLKQLDGFQVLKSVYSPSTNCLRVCVVEGSTGGGSGFEVIITHIDDSIRLGDGTNFFTSSTIASKIGLDVAIINEVNIRPLDKSTDNLILEDDDGDRLNIFSDGSLPVKITGIEEIIPTPQYGEISSVAANVETTLLSFTALADRQTYIQGIEASGENIAEYRVKIMGTVIDKKRSYHGAGLNVNFKYDGTLNLGYPLSPGQILTVTVIHQRPNVGDFNSKAIIIEKT